MCVPYSGKGENIFANYKLFAKIPCYTVCVCYIAHGYPDGSLVRVQPKGHLFSHECISDSAVHYSIQDSAVYSKNIIDRGPAMCPTILLAMYSCCMFHEQCIQSA